MDAKGEEGSVDTDNSENIMQGEKVIARKPKRHLSDKQKKLMIWGGSGLVVVLLVLALVLGFMAVVFKLPGQKVALVSDVCGPTVVDKYNSIMTTYYGDAQTDSVANLKALVAEFKKNPAYKQDPTCLFIGYRAGSLSGDYASAKEMFDPLQQLVKAGSSPSLNLDGVTSVATMQKELDRINPVQEADPNDY